VNQCKPLLRGQRKQGMCIYLTSQCESGDLHPELYQSGSLALELGQARHQTHLARYQMELPGIKWSSPGIKYS
jgi:hypothetical protein